MFTFRLLTRKPNERKTGKIDRKEEAKKKIQQRNVHTYRSDFPQALNETLTTVKPYVGEDVALKRNDKAARASTYHKNPLLLS